MYGHTYSKSMDQPGKAVVVSVCVCGHPIYSGRQVFVDVPAGVTQEEGQTGSVYLPSAVLAFIFLARRIQPFLSFIDRNVEFCILTI